MVSNGIQTASTAVDKMVVGGGVWERERRERKEREREVKEKRGRGRRMQHPYFGCTDRFFVGN